jgi:hypothetical protein
MYESHPTTVLCYGNAHKSCRPSTSYWDILNSKRDCVHEGPPLIGQAIVTIGTDFIVYVLPMPTLYRLSLPPLQRLGLIILFGMGGVVIIAGSFRTYWVHFVVYETYDVTWEGFNVWIWTAVEANLGVICGCIPALRPLLFPKRSKASAISRGSDSYFTSPPTRRRTSNTLVNFEMYDNVLASHYDPDVPTAYDGGYNKTKPLTLESRDDAALEESECGEDGPPHGASHKGA